jgi:hypothetical protein
MRMLPVAVLFLLALVAGARAQGPHHMGFGANYFVAVDNIDEQDVDEDGFGYFYTYQYRPDCPAGLELTMELLPDGYAGAEEDVYAPQAYFIFGSYVYLAAGIGAFYTDGELADDPFYAFRLGAELDYKRMVYFDVYTTYRFEKWDDLSEPNKNVGSDTLFLGAALRFGL